MRLSLDRSSSSANTLGVAGDNPEHQFHLHSATTLPANLQLNWTTRYVHDVPFSHADRYLTADLRLAWKPDDHLEIALSGHNLLDARHREFDPELIDSKPTEIQRSFHLTLYRPF
jgi:iron complex outermembrane receptor protein